MRDRDRAPLADDVHIGVDLIPSGLIPGVSGVQSLGDLLPLQAFTALVAVVFLKIMATGMDAVAPVFMGDSFLVCG